MKCDVCEKEEAELALAPGQGELIANKRGIKVICFDCSRTLVKLFRWVRI